MEAVIAVAGIIVCLFIHAFCKGEADESPVMLTMAMLAAIAALYFAVRFVAWSWATPIPFTN